MLPNKPYFLFNIDVLFENNTVDPSALKFINDISPYNRLFFTNDCDVSHKTCYKKLIDNNFSCKYRNILSPTYILIHYIKKIYGNFSAFPISNSKDLHDFTELKIPINDTNPNFIVLNTTKISSHDLAFLKNSKSIISLSYKLCPYGNLNCQSCKTKCIIEYIINNFNSRVLILKRHEIHKACNLFNKLDTSSRNLILVVDNLLEDYFIAQKCGCKTILVLNKKLSFNDYLNSQYDPDIVVDNFKNLSHFFKK